jgi:trk system potassium uptake protein TrkA
MNCCIIGLGTFGYNLAITLEKHGVKVLAIDSDIEAVKAIQDKVTHALCLHVYDEESLRSVGIDQVDIVAVAMGTNFEESILITALLKKNFSIPMVVCRSISAVHKEILELIGADHVVLPEQEAGIKLADKLSAKYGNFTRITKEYSIAHVRPHKRWIGKLISEIQLQEKYTIHLLGKRMGEIIKNVEDEYEIQGEDIFVCAGKNEDLEKIINQ